jgi:hypothetical protein
MSKSTTARITIFEPDEAQLDQSLVDRELSPELLNFLRSLLHRRKWARKINIPSGQTDVAAVLVFSTTLKEDGLEIFSELHVYSHGRIMIEKWQVVGGSERTALLPKEAFRAIDIKKVWVDGAQVHIEFDVPMANGQTRPLTKSFDFSIENPEVRVVAHPLFDLPFFPAEDLTGSPQG